MLDTTTMIDNGLGPGQTYTPLVTPPPILTAGVVKAWRTSNTAKQVTDAWRAASPEPVLDRAPPVTPAVVQRGHIPVILFNGPPGCGKDTAAEAIRREYHGARHMKFAAAVKDGTHVVFGLNCATDAFERVKNEPSPEFGGLTPRQAYIKFSEEAIKPAFGVARFGLATARRILGAQDSGATLVALSDCGFNEEIEPVADAVGHENMLLIRIFRPGCDFRNDSRNHVYPRGVQDVDISNDGSQAEFLGHVRRTVGDWLRRYSARRANR